MAITLYHFAPSPPSRTALLAFRVLDLDVNVEIIDLFAKEQLKGGFPKINPQHCLPTIDDNGFVLWESRAITGYLVRQYGKDDSWYPKNPQLKAVVDQRLYFDCSTLWPRMRAISFPALFLGETKVTQEKKDSLNDAIGLVEKFLHGRKWLTGDNPTIADLSTYSSMSSILAVGWNIEEFPNVQAWIARCKTLPGAEENEDGAKMFGDAVKSKLEAGQI